VRVSERERRGEKVMMRVKRMTGVKRDRKGKKVKREEKIGALNK